MRDIWVSVFSYLYVVSNSGRNIFQAIFNSFYILAIGNRW